jgi:YidC/Oxa1 family membrane protein insertase
MDKRLIIALAVSMAILVAWTKFFPPTPPASHAPPTPTTQTQAGTSNPAPAASPEVAGTADGKALPSNAAEERVSLESPDATYVLSSWGGTLREVHVKEKKFGGLQIVATNTPETAPLLSSFASSDFSLPPAAPFAVSRPSPGSVVFTTERNGVVIEKAYTVQPGQFQLRLEVKLQNKREKSVTESLVLHLFGKQDPAKKGGSFLSYASANLTEMVCHVADKIERNNVDSLLKGEKNYPGTVRWMAADEKFFTIAAVVNPETLTSAQKCLQRTVDGLTAEVLVPFTNRTLNPNETTTYAFTVFAGPKYRGALHAVQPGGEDPQLVGTVNSSYRIIAFLSEPLLYLLKLFQKFTHNWGFAIILLTLFVRLLTFYPQQRTMMSAKKMQKLAPKLAAIRKKYENDRQRQGVETMNLYKAHGVSPLGGCLPALIQMPIWMALFSTLNTAVELHRSGFIFYIKDLSAPDPYYATPLMMGVVMFLQMRMSPAGADPQQQKMMSVMMPIMFTVFSLFLPAGLAIYTLTSYLIGILQQLLVNYLDKRRNPVTTPAKA